MKTPHIYVLNTVNLAWRVALDYNDCLSSIPQELKKGWDREERNEESLENRDWNMYLKRTYRQFYLQSLFLCVWTHLPLSSFFIFFVTVHAVFIKKIDCNWLIVKDWQVIEVGTETDCQVVKDVLRYRHLQRLFSWTPLQASF